MSEIIITATRYHDFSCGHRVAGHESKCAMLHGHNYRVHFTIEAAALDEVGRVLDFSAIKVHLCEWLEKNWDHRFLAWKEDRVMQRVSEALEQARTASWDLPQLEDAAKADQSIVWVPFNPTAENMAWYLIECIGPEVLPKHARLTKVIIEETRKCSATATFR